MGVTGLWDVRICFRPRRLHISLTFSFQILRPSGKLRSLTHLAVVDGFERNPANLRGLRIGIDASIWFFHAAHGREGENPELRTLFFRCARLMNAPFLPLFVFDGPKRPKVKRGKRISGDKHWLVDSMKKIIEVFGYEWRMVCFLFLSTTSFLLKIRLPLKAPGEAEAELAHLNSIGVIDAILSDDVDNFLFGAKIVIRKCALRSTPALFTPLIPNLVRASISQATTSTPPRMQTDVWMVTTRPYTLLSTFSSTHLSSLLVADSFSLVFSLVGTTILPVFLAVDLEPHMGLRNAALVMNFSRLPNLSPAPNSPNFSPLGVKAYATNCAPTRVGISTPRNLLWRKPSRTRFLTLTSCYPTLIRLRVRPMSVRAARIRHPGGSANLISQKSLTCVSCISNGGSKISL